MTPELFLQLGVLALIDSTSIGTLVIPVWLLMRPGVRRNAGKVAAYLGAVGVFYFLVGLLLLSGAAGLAGMLGGGVGALIELPAVQWIMVAGGASMLIWSFRDTKRSNRKSSTGQGAAAAAGAGPDPSGHDAGSPAASAAGSPADPAAGGTKTAAARRSEANESRWQHRIGKALDSRGGLLGLAVLAGVLELPTMLPYLAAVGLLTTSGTPWAASAGVLGLYCLLMLVPAAVLLAGRLLLGRLLDGPLDRLRAWLTKVSGEAVLWVVAIAGFLLLRTGLAALYPGASWNPFGG